MVVHDAHTRLLVGENDGRIEFHERAVFPERVVLAVDAHFFSDGGKHVVAGLVAEVARADFCSHIPAIEWCRRKIDAANPQFHVGEDRDGIPLQA